MWLGHLTGRCAGVDKRGHGDRGGSRESSSRTRTDCQDGCRGGGGGGLVPSPSIWDPPSQGAAVSLRWAKDQRCTLSPDAETQTVCQGERRAAGGGGGGALASDQPLLPFSARKGHSSPPHHPPHRPPSLHRIDILSKCQSGSLSLSASWPAEAALRGLAVTDEGLSRSDTPVTTLARPTALTLNPRHAGRGTPPSLTAGVGFNSACYII